MSNNNWSSVYQSYSANEASIVEAFLKNNGIETILMNKKVSMHLNLNSNNPIDIMVPKEVEAKALELIKANKL